MSRSSIKNFCKKSICVFLTATITAMSLIFPAMSDGTGEYDLPWLWPVPGSYKINSLDYYYGGGMHGTGNSMDIGANGYTGANRLDVVSATNGTVQYIVDKYDENGDRGSGWGNYVIVTSGSTNIVYAHLQSVSCGYGRIKAGDVIGKMGSTGNSTAVHLHIQAYPANKNPGDTSILVFDEYVSNPLYAGKYEFMKGLETNSIRYGDHIKNNYTRLSNSYYSYTGDGDFVYPTDDVCAVIVVINTDGAPIRSVPLSDNTYITDTASFMEKLEICGVYTDAYGKIWLVLSDDYDGGCFISYDDVAFYDYGFSVSSENIRLPSGAYGGYTELPFGGYVASKNTIVSFTATLKCRESIVAVYTENVSSSKAMLDGIYEGFGIDYLADGDYTFLLTVKEKAQYPGADGITKDTLIADNSFTINSELSDKSAPVIERFSFDDVTSTSFSAVCRATDNRGIGKVVFNLCDADGNGICTSAAAYSDGAYRCTFDGEQITEECRTYKVSADVFDLYGNSSFAEGRVNLPPVTEGELWKASIVLKIRSGPGTTYTHLSSISTGSTFRIYDVAKIFDTNKNEGYIWGHHSKGYSPLGDYEGKSMYATYVEGHLYTVMFDLNGADGTAPASIEKRYGTDVTLPSTMYKRTGFTFLGWATDSGSLEAEYKPSDIYSADSDAVLYAVWGDNEKPVIDGVTLSTDEWTAGSVILKVSAHDNSGSLLYSFDYGRTWQMSDSRVISENESHPANSIAVRDNTGNIGYYDKEVVISNIDNTPPDVSDAVVDIEFISGRTVFAVSDVFDSESGLSEIGLVYSSDKEFTVESTLDVTNGGSAVLSDGIYYYKLSVIDIAGNISESGVGRFRVGVPEKLSVPMNIKVLSTGSGSAELAWDAVDNADKYEVNISKSGQFDDEISAYVRANTFEVSGLEAGVVYSFRVSAICDDNVYLQSDRSSVNTFLTKSNDTTVHSMKSMTDALISDGVIGYVAPYELTAIDITAVAEEHASVKYYSDKSLSSAISNITAYPFTSESLTLYVKVTAENGSVGVYRLDVTRAKEKAQKPSVKEDIPSQTVFVGDELIDMSVEAESTDGGKITVEWFMSYNDGEFISVGNENALSPLCSNKAGIYKFYAEITNHNEKCKVEAATLSTAIGTVTVKKRLSDIGVYCANKLYDGKTPSPSVYGYLGDGVVLYYYYSDAGCENQIDIPTDAGTYYVKAYAVETDEYLSCISAAVKFIISKAENNDLPVYNLTNSTLRNRNSYVDIISSGTEYRVKGSEIWIDPGDMALEFPEGTVLELRIKESGNYLCGKTVTVTLEKYGGPFEIVPADSSYVRKESGILYVNGKLNTVSDILLHIVKSSDMHIYFAEKTVLADKSDIVGTGCMIVIEDEEGIFASLDIVIIGDIDCDGDVTYDDVMLIMDYSNGTKISESPFDVYAGDMNGDGKLTASDAYSVYLLV